MSLGVLGLLVYENDRIRKSDKRLLYLTYALIAASALAADHEGQSAEMLVKESDEAMYEAKAAYYRISGKKRRRRR